MLKPHPATLRTLVEAYETLLAEETLAGVAEPSPRLRDLAYTLCVSTGTREVTDALDTAHAHLAATTPAHRSAPPVTAVRPRRATAVRRTGPVVAAGLAASADATD
ncbi:DUF5133 domain-containing protein [Streptomyces sp. TG1A-8]|uniref:DUF5133 domain-containing protein n=1 Tax=Streptomyces sp. TG1A-8 TaxID=3051385 RepID=UPI00265C81DA|nr:DUF5133 domain-containing protein [Streptomyces sp. TG1A-8]MDO0929183.1 DUF5133 domain-containing protein [Streptomyces sp. TG1A-8]